MCKYMCVCEYVCTCNMCTFNRAICNVCFFLSFFCSVSLSFSKFYIGYNVLYTVHVYMYMYIHVCYSTVRHMQHVDPVVARSFAQLAAVAVKKHKLETDPMLVRSVRVCVCVCVCVCVHVPVWACIYMYMYITCVYTCMYIIHVYTRTMYAPSCIVRIYHVHVYTHTVYIYMYMYVYPSHRVTKL